MSEQDMFSWYQKLYLDVENSKTYSDYCVIAFGKDFSQQGFSDMHQVDFMLSQLGLAENNKVLDIGCGTGKLDEHIYEAFGVNMVGVDYSPTAIQLAMQRTNRKTGLQFYCNDMDEIYFPNESFDNIFSIDAIFFSADLPKLLSKVKNWLKKGGKLAICYSEIRFDSAVPLDVLQPHNTDIGRAFEKAGLNYTCFDLTEILYKHMLLKRKTAIELKDSFHKEDNSYLFDYIYRESIPGDMKLSAFKEFQARFLYLYEK